MIAWMQAELNAVDEALRQYRGPRITGIEQLAQYRNDPDLLAYWRQHFHRLEVVRDLETMVATAGTRGVPHLQKDCPATCDGCPLCAGEVFWCAACGLVDGDLTTDCCGQPLTGFVGEAVRHGRVDFVNGQWVEGVRRVDPAPDERTEIERLVDDVIHVPSMIDLLQEAL